MSLIIVENHCFFWLCGAQFPSKFDIVIPKTPLYKCMVGIAKENSIDLA